MNLRVCRTPAEWAQASPGRAAVLTVGIFDGLHLGHQQILARVVERARLAAPAAVPGAITFDPHPTRVLRAELAPPLIATLAQRLAGFERLGLESALVLTFDRALSLLSPEEFVRTILVEHLRASAVLVGENFRFGHKQAGTVQLLQEFGQRFGFVVEVVPPVKLDGEIVSSTAIRQAVRDGDVARAALLLGRPFALTGQIQPGAGRGRTVLFPTLNVAPQQELLPKTGVYITETRVGGAWHRSATNVGFRPTVETGTPQLTVESHLFDFSQQVSAGALEVSFHQRLRDEMKFENVEALRRQIASDLESAKRFFQQQSEALRAGR